MSVHEAEVYRFEAVLSWEAGRIVGSFLRGYYQSNPFA